MNDDIVWRLRHIMTLGDMGVVLDAADEIERLRDALTECESVISRLKIEKKYTDGI